MKYTFLVIIISLSTSCKVPNKKANSAQVDDRALEVKANQVGQYVVNVFEDSKGNLWLGTIEKGVAKYDGKTLQYFTSTNGLPSDRVVGIAEDGSGNLWFGTGNGLSKFDGHSFTNFSEKDGLCNNMISNLLIDRKGLFWIGTWGGVCQFDGKNFTNFAIPYPKIETKINQDTKDWITGIKEDAQGDIWFARDGYGACKYDGTSFTHFTKKEGLHSNNVTELEVDKEGNVWFGTRVAEKDNPDPEQRIGAGGINRFDGETMISFPEIDGFNNGDVYEIYRDHSDNIWISTISNGVYKFDGKEYKNYEVPISIMSMTEDKAGNLWLGGAGGLYRINLKGEVVNVSQKGPWQ